jgi:SAM-dependent methyltransferase
MLRAGPKGIDLSAPGFVTGEMVDVSFDGYRAWTVRLPAATEGAFHLDWPEPLQLYLRGSTRLTLSRVDDPARSEAVDVDFEGVGRVSLTDSQGRRLVINKWHQLGHTLEFESSDFRQVLLERTQELLNFLDRLGYAVCITGGTLLGAVRSGDLLPRDDDADLAVLLPLDNPADLQLASFDMEAALVEAGYTVIRHSGAHLQVIFLSEAGLVAQYIDIFSAFFKNGEYCQPFHIRQPMAPSSILPFRPIQLGRYSFPGPAVPEDWCEASYGPTWRVPDHTFSFETPIATRRRFENWFGLTNMHRDFWEEYWTDRFEDVAAVEAATVVAPPDRPPEVWGHLPVGTPIVDLGCGDATVAAWLASRGHRVVAVDHAFSALALARRRAALNQADSLELAYLNLYDLRRVMEFAAHRRREARSWYLVALNVWESLDDRGQDNLFSLAGHLLPPAGGLLGCTSTGQQPEVWRDARTLSVAPEHLADRARAQGLDLTVIADQEVETAIGLRHNWYFMVRRADHLTAPQAEVGKQ